jgi:hypothetical protein
MWQNALRYRYQSSDAKPNLEFSRPFDGSRELRDRWDAFRPSDKVELHLVAPSKPRSLAFVPILTVRPGTAVGANVPRPYVPIVTISIPTGHRYLLDLARLPFDQSGNASGAFGMAVHAGGKNRYQDGLGSALGLPSNA